MSADAPPADLAARMKRLRYRSWHRGTKEADLLIGSFADAHAGRLSPAEIEQYEALLDTDDAILVDWLDGTQEAPAGLDAIVAKLRAHRALGLAKRNP